jgi:hypothetical protein
MWSSDSVTDMEISSWFLYGVWSKVLVAASFARKCLLVLFLQRVLFSLSLPFKTDDQIIALLEPLSLPLVLDLF